MEESAVHINYRLSIDILTKEPYQGRFGMTVTNQLDVLVIGAGIAGLSAAIALGKQGHRVVVSSHTHCCKYETPVTNSLKILEKSAFLREAGAAIHLPPNCTALLRWMDIDPVDFGGTLLNEVRFGDHRDTGLGLLFCIFPDSSVWIRWRIEVQERVCRCSPRMASSKSIRRERKPIF
jgi:hypothetical protein